MIQTLPEFYKAVDACGGAVTTNGGVTGKFVVAKTAQMIFLYLVFNQAVGHATVVTLKEATAVAGTSVKTTLNNHKIWLNDACATNDTLVRQTDGTSATLSTGTGAHMVVFGIDPAALDTANAFTTAGFSIATSGQATNFVGGVWLLQSRYAQALPPSAVID